MPTCNLCNNAANWYQLIRKLNLNSFNGIKKISFRCYLLNAKEKKKKGFCIEDSRKCESVKRCTRLPQRIHKRDDEAKTNDEKLMHLECRQSRRQNTRIRTRKIALIALIVLRSNDIITKISNIYVL